MRPFHIALAVLVSAIWGMNFIFVSYSLNDLPPILLGALRFLLASIPAIFFVRPPAIPFKHLFLYALFMFALQFTFLFLGLAVGMPAGLTSLVAQVQVFFSAFFAAVFLKEEMTREQLLGAMVAFSGIALVISQLGMHTTLLGFVFVILAAVSWGIGNLLTRVIGDSAHVTSLVAWACFWGSIPMLLLSVAVEGMPQIVSGLKQISWLTVGSLAYITYASTWLAYGVWSWLLTEYSIIRVAPFTMLVPVFGMFGAEKRCALTRSSGLGKIERAG